MNYAEISKETVMDLYKSHASLKRSPLPEAIRILVELRTSHKRLALGNTAFPFYRRPSLYWIYDSMISCTSQ